MKKTILFVMLFTASNAFSQYIDTAHVRKHEIGFGVTNIFNLFGGPALAAAANGYYAMPEDDYGPSSLGYLYNNSYNYNNNRDPYLLNAVNFNPGYGITYKYHYKKNQAIRAGIDFGTSNQKNTGHGYNYIYNTPDTTNSIDIKTIRLVLKAGYQFEKQIKKIMVFGGADAFYYLNKTDYYYTSSSSMETGTSNISGFGLTPFGGVLFRISEMFSISTEARFRWGYYTSTDSYSNISLHNQSNYSGGNSGTSLETKFSPLGLVSFNIHL